MNSLLDKLNLRPQERRLVVIVGLVVFVVLNIWLVWPQFGQVAIWEQRKGDAEKKLKAFKEELARKPQYEKRLKELETQGGYIASEERALSLLKDAQSEALLANLKVTRYDSSQRAVSTRTNAFFDEQILVISVDTGEKELVDFLYNMGARNTLIRVRAMSLRPDPTRMRLQGEITLVENFQKKKPTVTTPVASSKPAAPTAAPKATNTPPKGTSPKATVQPAPATNTSTNMPRKIPLPMPTKKT